MNTFLSPILPVSKDGELPLSFAQQRLWFLAQSTPDNPAYNILLAYRVTGCLNLVVLEQSLGAILQRHEALRTTFANVNGQPVQVIAPELNLKLQLVDLQELPGTERKTEAQLLIAQEVQQPFDLAQGLLWRVKLLRLSAEEYVFVLTMHHMISDRWSLGVFVREVAAFYEAFSTGKSPLLPELPIQYKDFAAWQRQWLSDEVLASHLSYWKLKLGSSIPMLQLPTDRPRPAVQSYRGASQILELPKNLTETVKILSRQEGVSLFMTLLAVFKILLYRYTGQEDIIVGSPIIGRNRVENRGLIGLFVNTLVLRTDLLGNPSCRELLSRIREVVLGAYAHQDFPFEKLVEELHSEQKLAHNPLFQVMFDFQDAPIPILELSDLTLNPLEVERQTAEFDLTFKLQEMSAGLEGWFEYNTDLFDAATISRIASHFQTLLEGVVANPERRLSELALLTAAERYQLLIEWNNTQADYPKDVLIHQLFEAQVEQTPDAVAVMFEDQQLTYRELNRRANQLAHQLQVLGVTTEVLVGLCVERSLEMVVGLLGILKAGGAYVPLDPTYPKERLSFMLSDAQVSVLLTQEKLLARVPEHGAQVVCLDCIEDANGLENSENLRCRLTADNLAYAIYTSGSTGKPKGVLGLHRGAVNRFNWMWETFPFEAGETCCQKTSLSFVDSVWEIFGPLLQGIPTVIIPDAVLKDPHQLVQTLAIKGVTRLVLVPSLLRILLNTYPDLQNRLPKLKYWVSSGEALSIELSQCFQKSMPESILLNLYGSSEVSADATWYDTRKSESLPHIPIGCPIANTQVYVLDLYLQPCPVGVPGELYIGGDGLALGYLNRPELTAERFIPNPFSDEPGARLYKTGDLTRYLVDGNIEFLGRLDHQVKIRGFRIELGEIEAVLSQHPCVRETLVAAWEDQPNNPCLIAYVVGQVGKPDIPLPEKIPTPSKLNSFLKEKLPEYMVPNIFAILDALPLTPNGKVDRRALPAPDAYRRCLEEDFVLPSTPTEEILASIWADILKLKQVGINDDFMKLGGHSLLAAQVISRVRQTFEVELPVRSLFESPTIAQLSQQIESARRQNHFQQLLPILPVSRSSELPLSFAQQGLWFLEQLEGKGAAYNMVGALRLIGQFHLAALEQSLKEIVRRHEALRTTFPTVNGSAIQAIASALTVPLPVVDLQQFLEVEQFAEMQRLATEEAHRAFDLANGPLLRVTLLRLSQKSHVLLWTMHHIISDGWSIEIFIRELATLYPAFSKGAPSPLPELSIQYADFACWQRQWLTGEVLETQLNYWKQQLAGAPPLIELPTDRPRPQVQTFQGSTEQFQLNPDLTQKLKTLSQESGTTLFMTLLATFVTLLLRYSGQQYICVGCPIANRNSSEIESLIGFFVNTLVLRFDLQGNPSFSELLSRVRQVALNAYAHQELPFEKLVQEIQPERNLSYNPLFQVMFVWQNVPVGRLEVPDLTITSLEIESGTAMFDLSLMMEETEQSLTGKFEYNTDLFEPATITRMVGHFQTLLEGIVANPQQQVSELPLLTPGERHQLLVEWNNTQIEYPQDRCIHQLFEAQVEQTPDAVAVMFEDQQLTYRELNRRVNQLAHHLQVLGVSTEVLVGLCVERSLEMVVGLLGILKAGGAYVPLDPTYPKERLSFMLSDAQVSVLLTQEKLVAELPEHTAQVVGLDTDWDVIEQERDVNPVSSVTIDNLAYVIYTSGSTGKPKGVLISHSSIANHCRDIQKYYELNISDRVLQFASLNFDASLEQILPTLIVGARLILRDTNVWTTTDFNQKILNFGITVVNLPPAYWQQVVQDWVKKPEVVPNSQLKLVIVGGDVILPEVLNLWRQTPIHSVRLLNAYGPTETTITATIFEIPQLGQETALKRIPIGRPLANRTLFILDTHGNPVPIGVPGELYIGGACLARGYLNHPELTTEKFIPNPFSDEPGARLYKTGDLARYFFDGNIEFLGRLDRQAKIRGFRIELGEIEAVLTQHPNIQEAVVIVTEKERGQKRLRRRKSSVSIDENDVEVLTQRLLSLSRESAKQLLMKIENISEEEIDLMLSSEMESRTENGKTINRSFAEFDISFHIKDDKFIRPPQESQRNWILQRALDEFSDDIKHLDKLSKRFISGSDRVSTQNEWRKSQALYDDSQLVIDGQQVMQTWQHPLMKSMANIAIETHGDVLEVGFGMGISATYIQEGGVKSHTIIEANDDVVQAFNQWKSRYPNRDIRLIHGKWQDVVEQLGTYDSVFFDTYPIDEEEFIEYVIKSITFAEHFLPIAAACLSQGGIFTYYTNEIDSFSRRHQRLLFKYFSSFTLSVVKPLFPPEDNINWWANSMVIVKAIK